MNDTRLQDLCPILQAKAPAFVQACANVSITTHISTTWRDSSAQSAAYAAGLSKAKPGQSPHECVDAQGNPFSKAFDFSIIREGAYISNGEDPAYTAAGAIGKALGLVWGGDFKSFPDYDHLEIPDWRNNTGLI